jgi:deoxycytidylate deaminase
MNKVNENIVDTLRAVAIANPAQGSAKVAAAVVRGKKIVAIGMNQNKSHPMQAKFNTENPDRIFLHAEIDAIKNALRFSDEEDLKKCVMYIVRVKRPNTHDKVNWIYGTAFPCEGCLNCLEAFQIQTIVYTLDNGDVKVQRVYDFPKPMYSLDNMNKV